MLTEERHDHIRRKLAAEGRVVAAELALEFDISEDTVRRDLRELARGGECRRVYGGALPLAPDLGSIAQRQGALVESKLSLARVVAGLVAPEQTLFVDAGSTNLAVAQALPRDLAITVVTNAPAVATALADHPSCRTMVIGGQFNSDKGACLGSHALRDIQRVRADLLILGRAVSTRMWACRRSTPRRRRSNAPWSSRAGSSSCLPRPTRSAPQLRLTLPTPVASTISWSQGMPTPQRSTPSALWV